MHINIFRRVLNIGIGSIMCLLILACSLYAQTRISAAALGEWSKASGQDLTPRQGFTSSVLGGRIYVIGGATVVNDTMTYLNSVQVYDPIMDAWSSPTVTGTFPSHVYHCAAVVQDRIYLMGGWTGGADTTGIYRYDIAQSSWAPVTLTGHFTHREEPTAATIDGKIYVFGGHDSTDENTLEVFDPATNTITTPQTTGVSTPRSDHGSAVVGGKMYVFGGRNHSGMLSTVEVFDPGTNTWSTPSTVGTMTPRHSFATAVVDDKIFVFGGWADSGPTSVVDMLDPATNTWQQVTTSGIFTPRYDLAASVVGTKVYVLGGYNKGTLSINEVFSLSTNGVPSHFADDNILISPNPCSDYLSIHVSGSVHPTNVDVYDVLGQRMHLPTLERTGAFWRLDTRYMLPGVYTLVLQNKALRFVKM